MCAVYRKCSILRIFPICQGLQSIKEVRSTNSSFILLAKYVNESIHKILIYLKYRLHHGIICCCLHIKRSLEHFITKSKRAKTRVLSNNVIVLRIVLHLCKQKSIKQTTPDDVPCERKILSVLSNTIKIDHFAPTDNIHC